MRPCLSRPCPGSVCGMHEGERFQSLAPGASVRDGASRDTGGCLTPAHARHACGCAEAEMYDVWTVTGATRHWGRGSATPPVPLPDNPQPRSDGVRTCTHKTRAALAILRRGKVLNPGLSDVVASGGGAATGGSTVYACSFQGQRPDSKPLLGMHLLVEVQCTHVCAHIELATSIGTNTTNLRDQKRHPYDSVEGQRRAFGGGEQAQKC